MSDLSKRMRSAANVLEEVSELFDYINPSLADWCAKSLRIEADQLEDE